MKGRGKCVGVFERGCVSVRECAFSSPHAQVEGKEYVRNVCVLCEVRVVRWGEWAEVLLLGDEGVDALVPIEDVPTREPLLTQQVQEALQESGLQNSAAHWGRGFHEGMGRGGSLEGRYMRDE